MVQVRLSVVIFALRALLVEYGLSHTRLWPPQARDFLGTSSVSSVILLPCNRFNIYCSYQQFFTGYYGNFADLCVEYYSLRFLNRLVFEAIGTVFFDVCF